MVYSFQTCATELYNGISNCSLTVETVLPFLVSQFGWNQETDPSNEIVNWVASESVTLEGFFDRLQQLFDVAQFTPTYLFLVCETELYEYDGIVPGISNRSP